MTDHSLAQTLWEITKSARYLEDRARTLEAIPVTDEQLVDTVGTIQSIERRLTAIRRNLTAEITGPQEGSDYRAVTSRKAKRSYNTNGILAAFGGDLQRLLRADAVRLTWRWTQLERECNIADVSLTKAFHEIEDGDPEALVGEVWTDDLRVEAIPAQEQEAGF